MPGPGHDDDTETSSKVTTDPALDATVRANGATPPPPEANADAAEELPRVAFIGRYRVIDVLGTGGMGVVYRARDPELDRELAIKVVRSHSGTSRAQERLLEEARSMAKLRHPAVVPVFDVGTTARGVFIVMPMVGGGTMHDWMKDPRPWREVVDRFITAGRGLAAAHAVGLVHRDFKPRNVLIGERGEVMVADFGIAARTDDSIDPERSTSTPGSAQVSSIAGTPAYMAPEQAESGTIDARADQYSFCVSMWEALCGERPHQAETRTIGGVTIPGVPSTGGRRTAPAWLLAAVERGFSAAPERRWPSMTALIEHIERRMRRPRRIAMGAAAFGLVAAAATLVLVAPGSNSDPCPDPRGRLASVWTPAIRAQIEKAFAASASPYADEALARIVPALDAYANSWRTKAIAVCRAARVERTQSDALMARRTSCLDRRLAALAGRTGAFRAGGAAIVEGATASVEGLPSLDDCDDTEALLAYTTAIAPDKRAKASALEAQLDEIEASSARGETTEHLPRLAAIVSETSTLDHPPLHARALEIQAQAMRRGGTSSEPTLRALVQAASEAHDDAAVVRAWSYLIEDLATRQAKLAEAKALEPVAEAALIRAGSTPALRYQLESALAERALKSDELDAALARWKNALAAASTAGERARTQTAMATALAAHDRVAEALPLAENAARETESARGAKHPETAARRAVVDELRARNVPEH